MQKTDMLPLRGRPALTDLIAAMVEAHTPAVLLIEGPPGSGRTHAVAHAAHAAAVNGLEVTERPNRAHAGDARPQLLCIDDLESLDARALDALWGAIRRPDWGRTAWVLSTVSSDRGPALAFLLARLEETLAAVRVTLEPLDAESALTMVEDLLGGPADRETRDRLRLAGGVPSLIAAAACGERALDAAADVLLNRLSINVRAGAQAAATLAERFSGADLEAALDLTPGRSLLAIHALLEGAIVRDDGFGGLAFTAPVIRAAALESVDPGLRLRFRRRAVRARLRTGGSEQPGLGATVSLLLEADELTYEDLLLLRKAVRGLARIDPASAGRLAALTLANPVSREERTVMAVAAVRWLVAAGEHDAAATVRATAPDDDGALRSRLDATVATAPFSPLERRLAAVQALSDGALGADTQAADLDAAVSYTRVLGGWSAPLPDADTTLGLLAVAVHDIAGGRFEEALARLSVRPPADTELGQLVALWRCEALVGLDCFSEAAELTEAQLAAARTGGLGAAVHAWALARGRHAALRGLLCEAERDLDEAQRLVPDCVMTALAVADVSLHRCLSPAGARRVALAAELASSSPIPEWQRHGSWLRIRAGLGAGQRPSSAKIDLPTFARDPLAELAVVRLALLAGDDRSARHAAAATAVRAAQNPSSRSLHAASVNAAGLIARDSSVLEQAAAEFAATLRPIPHAETLEDLAELLPRAGRIRALDEALAQYGRAGASADTSRIRLRLRTLGVERRSRSFSRPLIGWSSLTPAELKTVRLVALGMSNRAVAAELVVSPHTVNSHVRRSFTKLGISSRVQLARLVFAHDTAPAAPADGLAGPRGRSIEPRSPAHHHLVSRA